MAYENIKQIVDEYGIAKKTFENKMKNAFKEIFKTFFELYPEVQAVGWNQYTPYFNDGEPCEFGVADKYAVGHDFDLDDISSGYDLEESEFVYQKPSQRVYDLAKEYSKKVAAGTLGKNEAFMKHYVEEIQRYDDAVKEHGERFDVVSSGVNELMEVLDSIPEEIYHSAFGDHAFVLATKDGIDVREYDHD